MIEKIIGILILILTIPIGAGLIGLIIFDAFLVGFVLGFVLELAGCLFAGIIILGSIVIEKYG